MEPCLDCTKLLINAGIKRVVCERRYHAAHDSRDMLKRSGVKLEVLIDEEERYDRMQ
jgi:dCMP deaminase